MVRVERSGFPHWCVVVALLVVNGLAMAARSSDPEYVIDHWETDDGLPENSATAMVQDREGYLWFGTFRGLVRFNGATFTVFDPSNTPALPSAGIVSLHLDRAGRLWVGTLNGLAVRDGEEWTGLGAADGAIGLVPRSIAERSNGDLLFTDFQSRVVEYVGGRFRDLPKPPGRPGGGYVGLVSEKGRWWVAQSGFIGEWDGQRWAQTVATPTDHVAEVCGAASRDGGLWILVGRSIRKLRDGNEVSRVDLPEHPGGVWSLFEDSLGNIWISSYDRGVCRVSPTGAMRRWTRDDGLRYDGGRFVFEDREHTLWVGTSGGGLSRFKERRIQCFGPNHGILEPVVNSLCLSSDGSVWAATYGKGLFRLNGAEAVQVPLKDLGDAAVAYLQSVLFDSAGRLWVGTYDGGLCLIEGDSRRWIDEKQTGGCNIISLFEDSRGRVWMGGGRGIGVCEGGAFRELGVDHGLPHSGFCCIGEDSRGAIWASNQRAVFRLENDRFNEVLDPDGRSIMDVLCFKAEAGGVMWMGTRSRGLARWTEGSLVRLDRAAGWHSESVFAIVEDLEGYWWMPSARGIVRAAGAALDAAARGEGDVPPAQRFDRNDGMDSADCAAGRQPMSGRDHAGRLWFATGRGVATIDPATVRLNETVPQVILEEFAYVSPDAGRVGNAIDGGANRVMRPPADDTVVMPAGSRRVEIHYAGLSFVSPEKLRFQIMLNGIDPSWQDVGNRRVAHYPELPAREYTFRARVANDDGRWGPPTEMRFNLLPFFWQTLWFKSGMIVILIAASGGATWHLARVRHRRERERLEIQQQRDELIHLTRVNMLGELSGSLAHELNQPLTAILTNAQAAQRFLNREPADTGEVREILADIVKEDRRAGEIIYRLRALLKKGEVNRQPLEVAELVSDVVRLVHSDLVGRNIGVRTDIPDTLPMVLADRVQMQQVLLNLVVNACDAMAGAGREGDEHQSMIVVRSRASGTSHVQVSVIDQGPGIPRDQLERVFDAFYTTKKSGMGLGLSMCRTIIAAHGGRMWLENNPDRGVSAHFTLTVA